ncbi:Hypothetical predicted protein [Olea europaea subsp. europaea]|uniref:Uncharacterized protein n=1 Tax=Olea europaea subsp. europaea TaxID=158383 RepID=A0A8S0UAB7_OLEEU|nr:Hypothetical predicted protein [Olea europaea subsp. europaea]
MDCDAMSFLWGGMDLHDGGGDMVFRFACGGGATLDCGVMCLWYTITNGKGGGGCGGHVGWSVVRLGEKKTSGYHDNGTMFVQGESKNEREEVEWVQVAVVMKCN